MSFEDFAENEYRIYKTTTEDPMEFDDWYGGSEYLEDLYNQLHEYNEEA